ncbi:MAG: serine/threonine-protein kinase, partial [Nannocystaceae bacterium]
RASGEEVHEGLFASTSDALNPGSSASTSELLRPLTLTGALVGTPAYMSPEQYRGELVTAASDQFSFCVSLYQCLYGVLPFSTSSLAELRTEVLAGRVSPAPPRSQVPSRIYRALRRGMSSQPASRYPSMKELLADLDWHKATRKRWIGAAVASTALAGLGGFLTADAASPTVEICPDAQAELAGVWDDAERELVTAAITSIDAPRIDGVLSIALPYLDQYANAWVHMRNEACHTHAEGRQADGLFDRRMACLDQRRAGLDALVEVFATATKPDHLNSLSQATFSLPPLDPCGDADALLAELAPPEDPDLRAQVQNHRENLARASMLNFAGELPQGLEIVETITKDDKALAYPPLVAEVYQQLGVAPDGTPLKVAGQVAFAAGMSALTAMGPVGAA